MLESLFNKVAGLRPPVKRLYSNDCFCLNNYRYKHRQHLKYGCKLILSPFTGRRKRKAWKARETYMPIQKKIKFGSNRQGIILQRGMVR